MNYLIKRKYSKFLEERFNDTEYELEIDFEDLDNKLYEILFNVKNDRVKILMN